MQICTRLVLTNTSNSRMCSSMAWGIWTFPMLESAAVMPISVYRFAIRRKKSLTTLGTGRTKALCSMAARAFIRMPIRSPVSS